MDAKKAKGGEPLFDLSGLPKKERFNAILFGYVISVFTTEIVTVII